MITYWRGRGVPGIINCTLQYFFTASLKTFHISLLTYTHTHRVSVTKTIPFYSYPSSFETFTYFRSQQCCLLHYFLLWYGDRVSTFRTIFLFTLSPCQKHWEKVRTCANGAFNSSYSTQRRLIPTERKSARQTSHLLYILLSEQVSQNKSLVLLPSPTHQILVPSAAALLYRPEDRRLRVTC